MPDTTQLEADVVAAVQRWTISKDETEKIRQEMIETVKTAHDAGLSISRLTNLAKVQRMTVRSWLGLV